MNTKVLIAAAVAGASGAFVADIHAWSIAPAGANFAWGSAVKRWVAGAVSGLVTGGFGIGTVTALRLLL